MSANKRRVLFLDRDGTLIIEPEDFQIDSLEKLELVDGVIPALLKLKAAGYEFVIVSNQDGLGTDSNPLENFQPPHDKMLALFSSQGINFVAEHIDPHFESDNSPNRKPGIGMVQLFALLLSVFAPFLITPLLMLGGSYLCFEGAEKVWHHFRADKHDI